jgi:hypothetical protein
MVPPHRAEYSISRPSEAGAQTEDEWLPVLEELRAQISEVGKLQRGISATVFVGDVRTAKAKAKTRSRQKGNQRSPQGPLGAEKGRTSEATIRKFILK